MRIKTRSTVASEKTVPITAPYSAGASAKNTISQDEQESQEEKTSFQGRDRVEETKDLVAVHNTNTEKLNVVKSVHKRKNAAKMLANAVINYSLGNNTLFYINKNKAAPLLADARVTMPKKLKTLDGFIASIRDLDSKVKPKLNNSTESQQFFRWFGNWKKHPERINPALLNDDGTPRVFYHGTPSQPFDVFNYKKAGITQSRLNKSHQI